MKRTLARASRTTGVDKDTAAVHLAQTYLGKYPQELADEPGQLFPRDPARAQGTEDAVMVRIHELGVPTRVVRRRNVFVSRSFSWAFTLAAALVIALVSSMVTLGVLKSNSTVSIRFVLSAPEARSVTLVADFNNWSPESHNLSRSEDSGEWELVVPLRKGRSYIYNFVIDGEEWLPDPSAQGTIDDGLGGQASYISL